MSDATVERAFANKFKNDFIMEPQQRDGRLRPWVRDEPDFMDGKFGFFDKIGATSSKKKTTRHGDTPLVPTTHSRRRFIRDVYQWSDMIDRSDIRRLMKNPQNRYLMNARFAHKRDMDDVIIEAALGTSPSIDEDEAVASNITLPATQKVAAGGNGLTKAKILSALEILNGNDVDEDVPKVGIISSKQVTDLLGITEATNADYTIKGAIQAGRPTEFLGFTWVRSERLTLDGDGNRQVIFMTPTAVGFAGEEEPFTRVTESESKSYNFRLYMEWEMGAVRVEEKEVVEVACVES